MDQNSRLETKISKEETRTTITMVLGEIPPPPTRVSLQSQTSHLGTTVETMEDHMINAQISHSIELMEIDLGTNRSTNTMGMGEAMEQFLFSIDSKKRLLPK